MGVTQSRGTSRCPVLVDVMAESLRGPYMVQEVCSPLELLDEAGPLHYLGQGVGEGLPLQAVWLTRLKEI